MLAVSAVDEVRAANAAFYAAFEARDDSAMGAVWEHSERVSVTHPGWPTLIGWARVARSWEAIFANTPFIQFVLTEERVLVADGMALVTLDENILQAAGPTAREGDDAAALSGSRVAATNAFAHDTGRWRMVHHHGSPVSAAFDRGLTE